jgi:hypothetical protein
MKIQNLYWVTTPCNSENWFAIATSQKEARNLHDDGEGFDRGYSKAREICSIPNEIFKIYHPEKDNYWPSLELLEKLGFNIAEREFPRIASFDSKLYYEGSGMIKIIEYHTSKFPGLYVVNILNTDKYKVGFTKNLSARLSAFRTAIPFPIRLKFYIMTEFHKELEKELHLFLMPNLTRREWFSLNEVEINALKEKLNELDKSKFHFVDYTEMPYER